MILQGVELSIFLLIFFCMGKLQQCSAKALSVILMHVCNFACVEVFNTALLTYLFSFIFAKIRTLATH